MNQMSVHNWWHLKQFKDLKISSVCGEENLLNRENICKTAFTASLLSREQILLVAWFIMVVDVTESITSLSITSLSLSLPCL